TRRIGRSLLTTTLPSARVPLLIFTAGPREEDQRKPVGVDGSRSRATSTWIGGPSVISLLTSASLPSRRVIPREVEGKSATQVTRPRIAPYSSRLTVLGATWTTIPGCTRLPEEAGTKSTAIR